MADKTPVRVVFNSSNVATGLAEFQSGDTIPVANGGTGVTAIGSAGQVLKVNAAGTALEFGAEGDISITNLVAPTNSDLTLTTSGTGNIVLDAITFRGTTISSADSSTININENVIIDGNLTVEGTVDFQDQNISNVGSLSLDSISGDADSNTSITFSGSDVITMATGGSTAATFNADQSVTVTGALVASTSINIASDGATVTGIKDEDGMDSNSATKLATQQSIKAYVDAQVTAQDLDFQGDSGGALSIDLDSETLDIAGGTGIDTAGSSNTLTVSIDSTVATLTGSQTLTNKILTSPTISTPTVTGTLTATSVTTNDIVSNGSNANINIDPQGTGKVVINNLSIAGETGTITTDSSNMAITFDTHGTGDINLTAGADVNLPADIGLTFGDDGEKIEGDGTDLTIASSNDLNLTATTDINVPANVGMTFGNDAEKIEGDGTDLTISGNNIKLTAVADVIIPTNVGLHFTDANEKIESDGSKLILTSGGTTFNLPTSDGSSGQALVTDGAGTLSFDTVATTISDDTLATVRNNKSLGTAARTIDSINATFIDSAFYFLVHNDLVNEVISAECLAITNNDTASFLGNRRGIESAGGSTVPTLATDVSNGQFRIRATGTSADCKASFYKIAMSSSTTDATRGNTVTTSNTDVDSASESIDTFAHGTYRGAKYFISVDNDSKTEMDVVEALVVHDGSDAYIKSYGHNSSGGDPLITLTAAISGSNVVVSAAGLETNLNLTIHKILLKDNMTAESNANQKAFASVTVSSTATAVDLMDLDDGNGAVYFIVGANSTESAYSIQEVYTAATPGVPAVANGPFVSTKGTTQLEFTAAFDTATENSLELFASSTSGGSTTVSGYRISALAG